MIFDGIIIAFAVYKTFQSLVAEGVRVNMQTFTLCVGVTCFSEGMTKHLECG